MSRIGLLISSLTYNDSLSGIYAEHLSRSAIIESEINYKTRINHLLNFGIHERIDWGKSDNYINLSHRNNLAFLLSYKLWNLSKTLYISGSIRQELIDKTLSQPTPAFGLSYELNESFQISGKLSRNYRQPTFNDLFWQGGFAQGNPDLLPESAWAQDLGIVFHKLINQNSLSWSTSVFNTYIKNLILWIQIEGIWTPLNQKEVWTRGIETDLKLSRSISKLKLNFEFHYSFNPSTLEKTADNESSVILKKQLIYTPKHQVKALFYLQHSLGNLSIEQQYVSKRFTKADNTSWLEAYPLTNLIISKSIKKTNNDLGLSFRLNNLLNQKYQSMENYALPGRNYQISIHYNIN